MGMDACQPVTAVPSPAIASAACNVDRASPSLRLPRHVAQEYFSVERRHEIVFLRAGECDELAAPLRRDSARAASSGDLAGRHAAERHGRPGHATSAGAPASLSNDTRAALETLPEGAQAELRAAMERARLPVEQETQQTHGPPAVMCGRTPHLVPCTLAALRHVSECVSPTRDDLAGLRVDRCVPSGCYEESDSGQHFCPEAGEEVAQPLHQTPKPPN